VSAYRLAAFALMAPSATLVVFVLGAITGWALSAASSLSAVIR